MKALILANSALPAHLTERNDNGSLLIVGIFVAGILVIALARLLERDIFLYLIQGVFLLRPLDDLATEEYKPRSAGSILFVILFALITAGSAYRLFFVNVPPEDLRQLWMALLFPTVYLLYQLGALNVAAGIINAREQIRDLTYFTLIITQFFGLIFLLELFVTYFQPGLLSDEKLLFGITYLIYLSIRFIRGFWIAINQGISWYYIILYFWTLEILPLLIILKLLFPEVFRF